MRILTIDIETFPGISHYWSTYKTTLGPEMLITEPSVACVAAKWLDGGRVLFQKAAYGDADEKAELVSWVYGLLDEADAVVHFNGQTFDIPHLNREFWLHGLTPPSPFKQIDLLQTAKRQFNFASNRLAHLGPTMVGAAKEKTGGMGLWLACMDGDPKAWKQMAKYNKQDVRVTEELYLQMRPWILGHPNTQLYDGHAGCPTCGSEDFQRRGFAYTPQSKFVKLRCNACGKYWRRTERVAGVKTAAVR